MVLSFGFFIERGKRCCDFFAAIKYKMKENDSYVDLLNYQIDV